jgi:hypothetical protein
MPFRDLLSNVVDRDGYFRKAKLREGDIFAFSRNPSQEGDSALPMRIIMTSDKSTRVQVNVCKRKNMDFDEDWGLSPGGGMSENSLMRL